MRKRSWMIAITSMGFSFALISAMAAAKMPSALQDDDNCKRPKQASTTAKHESPFACDRLALDPEARTRHFDELGPALRSLGTGVRELPDGYEFQFPADPKTIGMVAEWAAGERLCCPFLYIELRMEAEHGPFRLRLTGRKGAKALIAASWSLVDQTPNR